MIPVRCPLRCDQLRHLGWMLAVVLCAVGLGAVEPPPEPKPHPKSKAKAAPAPKAPAISTRRSRLKHWPGQGDPEVERVRNCILTRESEGHYDIVDPSGRWFGAYQFTPETSDTAAQRMNRPDLVGITADRWKPWEQDAGFYVIFDRGNGKAHWANGRYECL